MNSYETSAIVEEQGRILLAGVPFAPGTQVEVVINILENSTDLQAPLEGRAQRLLAALDKAHNVAPIGAFNRGELYDRGVLH